MKKLSDLYPLAPAEKEAPNGDSIRCLILAMVPAMIMSAVFFGHNSLVIIFAAVLSSMLLRFIKEKYLLKREASLRDRSAMVTGILLAFCLPAGIPVWLVIPGSLIAIGMTGISLGKLGQNPFNTVLTARVFLHLLFPAEMTTWTATVIAADSFTGATPLSLVKDGLKDGNTLSQITSSNQIPGYFDLFWGNVSGSLGEISAIAILLGGLYLIWRKIITWHIPAAVLGTLFFSQGTLWVIAPEKFMDPLFHLVTGGAMLGAFFLSTDRSTSPDSSLGKLIVGAGIGIITVLIRNFGSGPEGISIAILVMNGFTPLINARIKARAPQSI